MLIILQISYLFHLVIIATVYISTNVAKKENKTIECPNNKSFLTQKEVLQDYNNGNTRSLAYCYCTANFSGRLNELFPTKNGNKRLCLNIYNDVLRQIGLSFLIAVLLTVSSMILDKLLHILSGFEKYDDLNSKYSSRILKGFIIKYANSGIIILFINLKIKLGNKSLGRYDDMTPTWYVTVGYSVVFTYVLKIISLLIWTFLRVILPWLKRFCDRGCSNDMNKTKKKTLAD